MMLPMWITQLRMKTLEEKINILGLEDGQTVLTVRVGGDLRPFLIPRKKTHIRTHTPIQTKRLTMEAISHQLTLCMTIYNLITQNLYHITYNKLCNLTYLSLTSYPNFINHITIRSRNIINPITILSRNITNHTTLMNIMSLLLITTLLTIFQHMMSRKSIMMNHHPI